MAKKRLTPRFIIPPNADVEQQTDIKWKVVVSDGTNTWTLDSVTDITTKSVINELLTWSVTIWPSTSNYRTNLATFQDVTITRNGVAQITDGKLLKIRYATDGQLVISGAGKLFNLRRYITGQAWQFTTMAFNTLVSHLNDADDNATNICSGATMSASSAAAGWAAAEANDGTKETDGNGWKASSSAVPAWLKVDFATNKTVKRVRICRYVDGSDNCMPVKFKVEYSTDDSTYTSVNTAREWYYSSTDAKFYDVRIPQAVTARYIRVTIIAMGTGLSAGVGELEVWESSDIVTEGTIENLGTVSHRFDGETRLKAMAGAVLDKNGEFMETSAGALAIAASLGNSTAVKGFKSGKNIEFAEYEKDAWDIVNLIDQRGTGEGADQLTLHAESTTYQSTFGVCEAMTTDGRIEKDATMATKAATLISNGESNKESVKMTAHYWGETVTLGDTIHAIDTYANLDSDYRVVGIIRKANGDSGEGMEYLLTNKKTTLSSKLAPSLNLDGDTLTAHPQGAPSFNSFQDLDNCGTGYPLNLKVRIPTTAITSTGAAAINKVLLSYYVTNYRSFQTTSAAESSHTHNLNIAASGAHTHSVDSVTSGTVSGFGGLQYTGDWFYWYDVGTSFKNIITINKGSVDLLDEVFMIHIINPAPPPVFAMVRVANITDGTYYPDTSGIHLQFHATEASASVSIHTGKCNKNDQLQLQMRWSADPGMNTYVSSAYYEIGEHKHNVSGQTASSATHTHPGLATGAGSSHTHGNVFGISEATGTPTSVTVKIDGTDRTTALGITDASDQTDLDITQYLVGTGNHTIAIEPNKNCRIHGQSNVWLWVRN